MLFKNQKQIIENGQTKELKKARNDVLDILTSALDAADPYKTVKSKFHGKSIVFEGETIDISDFKNILLVGFGKASIGILLNALQVVLHGRPQRLVLLKRFLRCALLPDVVPHEFVGVQFRGISRKEV
jgi:hypothetical protein